MPFQGAPGALTKSPSPHSCATPTAATATTRATAGVPRAASSAVRTPPTMTCSTSPSGRIQVHKAPGKIGVLEKQLGHSLPAGRTGIAHTRWATHGAPNTVNAHPHTDCGGTLALIHNGIIENAGVLRTALAKRGHVFRSETDTEVLAHLIEELLAKQPAGTLVEAVAGALHQVEGTYGIAVVATREPDTIIAARRGSPLLVAIGAGENFVASD